MKKYSLILLGGFLILFLGVGLLNWLVDPYQLRLPGEWPSVALDKTELKDYIRLSKITRARKMKPELIVLGTSRSEIGIDPNNPVLGHVKSFNLAFPGQHVAQARRIIEDSVAEHYGQKIIWGLDFYKFNCNTAVPDSFINEYFDSRNIKYIPFSISTFNSSLFTLLGQFEGYRDGWDESGFRHRENYVENGVTADYYNATLKIERTYAARHLASNLEIDCAGTNKVNPLSEFRHSLRLSYSNGKELTLYIIPEHARMTEIIYQAGIWDEWENWKRKLVSINNAAAREAGRKPYPLWDFSGFNRHTTEQFQGTDGEDAEMFGYWESAHFKKELGNLILERMFSRDAGRYSEEFGVLLTADNIDTRLELQRKDKKRFESSQPGVVSEIQRLVNESKRRPEWRRFSED